MVHHPRPSSDSYIWQSTNPTSYLDIKNTRLHFRPFGLISTNHICRVKNGVNRRLQAGASKEDGSPQMVMLVLIMS